LLNMLGRGLGVLSGGIASLCWVVAMWVPAAGLPLTGVSFVVALFLALLALIAAIASVHGHAVVVVLVFLASFFPVGITLISADHWSQWLGWLDLGFLVASALMWATSGSARGAKRAAADERLERER
jgi:hypothetical protein